MDSQPGRTEAIVDLKAAGHPPLAAARVEDPSNVEQSQVGPLSFDVPLLPIASHLDPSTVSKDSETGITERTLALHPVGHHSPTAARSDMHIAWEPDTRQQSKDLAPDKFERPTYSLRPDQQLRDIELPHRLFSAFTEQMAALALLSHVNGQLISTFVIADPTAVQRLGARQVRAANVFVTPRPAVTRHRAASSFIFGIYRTDGSPGFAFPRQRSTHLDFRHRGHSDLPPEPTASSEQWMRNSLRASSG